MKKAPLFLFLILCLLPTLTNGDPAASDKHKTLGYLKDLEELGYCVIPRLFSISETEQLYERVWYEYIEKAWPKCKMNDRSNWNESFPMHNVYGIFAGPAGQTQVMWDIRQDPRIVDVFAHIWNTDKLIVSMDGLSFMCPPEIREGPFDPWPHVDQTIFRRQDKSQHDNNSPVGFISESNLLTKPFTIQGQLLLEDSFDGDGGFYCIPKSHLKFSTFAPVLEALDEQDLTRDEKIKARNNYLIRFFDQSLDESGAPYTRQQIIAPRGSLILWDSRTVHWNQHPRKERTQQKVRMVAYLCYVPKARLTEEGKALRKEAFETGTSTGHNPSYPELKRTKIREEFAQYLEDPNYAQPTIHLSPLGLSLLGF